MALDRDRLSELPGCLKQHILYRDRLSELPGCLKQHILSYLPAREAAATMCLSESWKDVWKTMPRLNFSQEIDVDCRKFSNFVSRFVELKKGVKIGSFNMLFHLNKNSVADVHSCLKLAVDNKVEELRIESDTYPHFFVPKFVCSCPSIRKLIVVSVELDVNSVRMNNLESLTFEGHCLWYGNTIERILPTALALKELNLRVEEFLKTFTIESPTLKKIKIEYSVGKCSREWEAVLMIDAVNLETLENSEIWKSRCFLKVPFLKNATLGFANKRSLLTDKEPSKAIVDKFQLALRSMSDIQNLTLNEWSFKLLVDKLENEFWVFPNAKSVKLYSIETEGILRALNLFPVLEMLVVEHKESTYFRKEALTEIIPYLSILKSIVITWDVKDATMLDVVEFLLENAPVLERLKLCFKTGGVVDWEWCMLAREVRRMPRASRNAEVICFPK